MKKRLCNYLFILLAFVGLTFSACDHNNSTDPNEGTNTEEPNTDNPNTDDPATTYSILGTWKLDLATQYTPTNDIDMTNFYGTNFRLIFQDGGILIVNDGINSTNMQWTLEGDQLAFIQAPGMAPVMYTVKQLNETNLVIENGTGTDYVTVMELHRITE